LNASYSLQTSSTSNMPPVSIKATMLLILKIVCLTPYLVRQYLLSRDNWNGCRRTSSGYDAKVGIFLSSQLLDSKNHFMNRELEQQMVVMGQKWRLEQERLNNEMEKVEAAKAVVRQNEANNGMEASRIRTQKSELENQRAIVERDHQLLEKRELQIRLKEDQRRRNRFVL
jgi:hypothetical protein